jgi:hypothetical protein
MGTVIDCFGVPEYFVTHVGSIEDAGGGMVRIVRCIERNNVLIPVFSMVTPAIGMMRLGPIMREFCEHMVEQEMRVGALSAH